MTGLTSEWSPLSALHPFVTIERVNELKKEALHRADDNEFLGFLVEDRVGWQAQTIFGYPIARTESRRDAERILQEEGLGYLAGVWQYYDKEDGQWYPCVIKEAYEHRVTVVRTNERGYQDPDTYKYVTIKEPNENTLIKSA
jgi:hypothetical protein